MKGILAPIRDTGESFDPLKVLLIDNRHQMTDESDVSSALEQGISVFNSKQSPNEKSHSRDPSAAECYVLPGS
jgi:hypothetical protein